MNPPREPRLPQKQIEKVVEYYNLTDKFCGGDLEYLLECLEDVAGRKFTYEDFQYIEFNVNSSGDYYDDKNMSYLEVEYSRSELVDNPNYDKQYETYLKDKTVYDDYWTKIKKENKEKELNEKLAKKEEYLAKIAELDKEIENVFP